MTTTEHPTEQTNADDAPEEEDERGTLEHLGSFAKELFLVVIGAIIVSTLLRMFVGQMFLIPSASMEGTLLIGDRVVAEKVTDFDRGDVVVFGDPGGWLRGQPSKDHGPVGKALEFVGVLPSTSKGNLIKRVIGLPGDKVICCDRAQKVTVNGRALDESSYLYRDASGTVVAASEVKFEVIVPKDHIFVMGDHRNESADSRCHLSDPSPTGRTGDTAFIPMDLVVGSAIGVIAPFNRAMRLPTPDTFAGVPAAAQPAPDSAVIKPVGISC